MSKHKLFSQKSNDILDDTSETISREKLKGSYRRFKRKIRAIADEHFRFIYDPLAQFFLAIFIISTLYITFIETEKYVSESTIMIKNLSPTQADPTSLSTLITQGSSSSQDAQLVEVYARSFDMYSRLDKDINLTKYYTSDELDWIQRLSNNAILPSNRATNYNLLERYNKDLITIYDDASGTLSIEFAYANPEGAREIVKKIIKFSSDALNKFEKENAQTALKYLKRQAKIKKERFMNSIKRLIDYQNKHSTFSPTSDVERKSAILASLESLLVQKEVEYKNRLQYMNKNSSEMILMRGDIENIKKRIKSIRSQLASPEKEDNILSLTTGKQSPELNKYVYDFELLKNQLDFNKQLYTQTLVKLEELKVQVSQNAKNIIVVTKPTLSDEYRYPQKLKDIISIMIVLGFLYGIISAVIKIIKDHKD